MFTYDILKNILIIIIKCNLQKIKEELLNSSFMFFVKFLYVCVFHNNYILMIQYLFLLNKYYYKPFKRKLLNIIYFKYKVLFKHYFIYYKLYILYLINYY